MTTTPTSAELFRLALADAEAMRAEAQTLTDDRRPSNRRRRTADVTCPAGRPSSLS